MKRAATSLVTVLMAALLTLTACSAKPTSESPADPPTTAASLPTVDRAGNPITLPPEITRVISLAPSITQVLDALGLKDRLVGIDTQTPRYVPGLDSLPQFDMMQPDLEAMLALQPDLVLVSGISLYASDDPFKPLKDVGIPVAVIPTSNSIEDVMKDIQFIAGCFGKQAEGEAIVAQMRAEIDRIAAIGATITEKKRVMFEIAPLPTIYSFGSGVFLHEMLELIGAENVFADHQGWMAVTEESAIAANPDVILTNVNDIDDPVQEILSRSGWENVTAVKNRAVYYIDTAASSLPNHHIVDALKQMARAVYPDQYAAIGNPLAP
ncbi:MAG TPA: ABC transporter substrate-binding protein [Symbiobacteriaceae bacterium]